jgi:hypothetical protein
MRSIAERGRFSVGEALCGTCFGFRGFLFAILGRRGRFERTQEAIGDGGNLVNGRLESLLIRFGRLIEARDFSNKLERSGVDFFISDRRIEIEEGSYISAHGHQLAFRRGTNARSSGSPR